jgi:STE24 endopeptidase
MNIYLTIIVSFLLFAYALEQLARVLDLRSMSGPVPPELESAYDQQSYRKTQAYARDRGNLSLIADTCQLAVILGFIFLGGFPWLAAIVQSLSDSVVVQGLAFFGLLGLGGEVLSLPFDLWSTFVIEERYGFNRTTPRTFVADKLKGLALTVLIGGGLAAAVLWLFASLAWAWLLAWGLMVVVMLGLQYVAPIWILPLFNHFEPLSEGELRDRIEQVADDAGYELSGIYVMDGSKRSTKANAFFAGFGKRKRIALYDTLVEDHGPEELAAVLAHEIGHSKLGHVLRMTVASALRLGLMLWLVSIFIDSEPLHAAFGMTEPTVYTGLVMFGFLYAPVSLVLALALNKQSRIYEYAADRFAARLTGAPGALARALRKLSADTLSNPRPHPLTVALHYSHPPVAKRIRALEEMGE